MYNDFKEYPKWIVTFDGKDVIVNSKKEEEDLTNEPKKHSNDSEGLDNKGSKVVKSSRARGRVVKWRGV